MTKAGSVQLYGHSKFNGHPSGHAYLAVALSIPIPSTCVSTMTIISTTSESKGIKNHLFELPASQNNDSSFRSAIRTLLWTRLFYY